MMRRISALLTAALLALALCACGGNDPSRPTQSTPSVTVPPVEDLTGVDTSSIPGLEDGVLTDSQGRWVCDLAGQSTCTVHMQRREALEEECRLAVASYDAQGRFLSVAIYSVEAGSGTFSAQLTLPAGAGMVKIFLMSDQYAPLSSFASI